MFDEEMLSPIATSPRLVMMAMMVVVIVDSGGQMGDNREWPVFHVVAVGRNHLKAHRLYSTWLWVMIGL